MYTALLKDRLLIGFLRQNARSQAVASCCVPFCNFARPESRGTCNFHVSAGCNISRPSVTLVSLLQHPARCEIRDKCQTLSLALITQPYNLVRNDMKRSVATQSGWALLPKWPSCGVSDEAFWRIPKWLPGALSLLLCAA